MNDVTLYISLEQSTAVNSRKVCVGDIAKLFCRNVDIAKEAANIKLFTFNNSKKAQQVITALKIIEEISINIKDIHIENIGDAETIVYYKNIPSEERMVARLKPIMLIIFAFLGTGYSIMSYNGDVGSRELLEQLYTLFTGNDASGNPRGLTLGIIMYCIGLCIGMITFFNHGINQKDTDDPTPLQVQMRLYEQNVNQSIIIDSERNKETIDVD